MNKLAINKDCVNCRGFGYITRDSTYSGVITYDCQLCYKNSLFNGKEDGHFNGVNWVVGIPDGYVFLSVRDSLLKKIFFYFCDINKNKILFKHSFSTNIFKNLDTVYPIINIDTSHLLENKNALNDNLLNLWDLGHIFCLIKRIVNTCKVNRDNVSKYITLSKDPDSLAKY